MQYQNTRTGRFLDRPNRFLAHVEVDGVTETVHVKNTGRCGELLLPHAPVVLQRADNPNRKTGYDLIAVYKERLGWVNIDSQAPNQVMKEWLVNQKDVALVRPEYRYGESRIDFYLEGALGTPALMEVKGVTLERDGTGYFPDAPTERGIKHIRELETAIRAGYQAYLAFVIQMQGISVVRPNDRTHPQFGEALRRAVANGLKVLYLGCRVDKDTLTVEFCHEAEVR